jgi:hypothetical protein
LIRLAAWAVVVLCALGWHPALRDGAPLGELGRHIAEDAGQGRSHLDTLFMPGGGPSFAFWALNLSLFYVAGWGLFMLTRRGPNPPTEIPNRLLIAVIAGQAAACFASNATIFYFLTCGIAALGFQRSPPAESRLSPIRLSLAFGLGLLCVALASLFDTALPVAKFLPEAWFPLVVERPGVAIALSLVVAAACAALGFVRSGWLGLAPACVLVLGPSNPAKGLAAAAVVVLLGRAGAGPLVRSAFLAAVVALFAGIALRV